MIQILKLSYTVTEWRDALGKASSLVGINDRAGPAIRFYDNFLYR